ncbi:basic region leucine zipper domain-containing protein [Phthorimaea operculella]|nr:basic region leucine zipper domain-containing protein [Phthorimaea operculella]
MKLAARPRGIILSARLKQNFYSRRTFRDFSASFRQPCGRQRARRQSAPTRRTDRTRLVRADTTSHAIPSDTNTRAQSTVYQHREYLKKAAEDKRAPFPPPDLDELNGQEISLDLQHLIEDQFRGEETMALFQEILPGGRSPQQRQSFSRTTLAYMPQPVHSGASYANPVPANAQHEQGGPPIKEEPPEPHDFRRNVTCAPYQGQYNPQPPIGVSTPYGGGFTPLPPLGAPLLPPLLKHKQPPSRRSSGKAIDKGTDEYRRRRERNNIAVRKSREKAKVRSREVEEKVKTLLREKDALLKRLEAVSGELSLHKQMYVHLINLNHPEITELCRSMLQLGAPHGQDHTL